MLLYFKINRKIIFKKCSFLYYENKAKNFYKISKNLKCNAAYLLFSASLLLKVEKSDE